MNGKQAVEYIHSFYGMGKKTGLENGFAMMELLGNPHRDLKCVHVAGTNGKGSICAYVESVLRAQGYKTGLYTSPYLQTYNERIRVDGAPIADADLGRVIDLIKDAVEVLHSRGVRPTEFEIGTAAAFKWFSMAKVDYAVIEVGLGGRLDPTNIITPMVSVIANIGLDHVRILGDTPEQIAFEKAGIIKNGVPVVLYPQTDGVKKVIEDASLQRNAQLRCVNPLLIGGAQTDRKGARFSYGGLDVRINVPGAHQIYNASTALEAVLALRDAGVRLEDRAILKGMQTAFWPGRLEWARENILIDGAHNPQGAASLRAFVKEHLGGKEIALVCGVLRDKAFEEMAGVFADFADYAAVVEPDSHRALDADALTQRLLEHGVEARRFDTLANAVQAALAYAGAHGCVVIAGSLYLAGEAKNLLQR